LDSGHTIYRFLMQLFEGLNMSLRDLEHEFKIESIGSQELGVPRIKKKER